MTESTSQESVDIHGLLFTIKIFHKVPRTYTLSDDAQFMFNQECKAIEALKSKTNHHPALRYSFV